ncbi:MAG: InlB B-repeat-containing protein [Methanobrevibacter sp.]|nr:InlB B-repeat-containing protein [Methanobrevibacter sp.]
MKVKKLCCVLALAILIFSMGLATAHATNEVKTEKRDNGLTIESKEKVASYKITWNANGGKIGSKNTKVTRLKKGSKIGKLAATPKRSGYTFKGWYTKKSGGTKITKNTKPKKIVIYYAQWKKGSSTSNTNTKSKLMGAWKKNKLDSLGRWHLLYYNFHDNGKFLYTYDASESKTGNYKMSEGKITFTNIVYTKNGMKTDYPKQQVVEYKFEKESGTEYLKIAPLEYGDRTYVDFGCSSSFYK